MVQIMSSWWDSIIAEAETDPAFIAECISQELAMQINDRLGIMGLSRKKLASLLNVSQPYVSELLNAKTNLTMLSLSKIACALELWPRVDLIPKERPAPDPICRDSLKDEFFSTDLDPMINKIGRAKGQQLYPMLGANERNSVPCTYGQTAE